MNTFSVSQECLELGLRAGAIVLRDVHVHASTSDQRRQIDEAAQTVGQQFTSAAQIRSLPELQKLHEVLRNVGVRPRSHPPSTQRLLEFALKRGSLPAVNNLVDAYNLMSLRSKCSLGAHDLDRLALPVQLSLFRGDESFCALGETADQPVNRGEFGYVDAARRVICRLDSRQADFSKVTTDTTNVLLIIESTTVHAAQQLKQVFADTVPIVGRFCGGSAEVVAWPD